MSEAQVNCPYCEERKGSPDEKKHLYVYGDGRGVHCFRCGFTTSKVVPREVLALVDGLDRVVVEEPEPEDVQKVLKQELVFARPATKFSRAVEYINSRIPMRPESIDALGLLYAPWGKYAGRIIFPMRDAEGKIGYFVARAIGDSPLRYMNPPVPKTGWVYPVLTSAPSKHLAVVEGVFDALAVAAAGIPAVALLGKRISAEQARRIGSLAKFIEAEQAVVLLDQDALSSAVTVSYDLSFYISTSRKELPPGVDPAQFFAESGAAILRYTIEDDSTDLRTKLTGVDHGPIDRGLTEVARTGRRPDRIAGRKRGQPALKRSS